MRPRSPHGGAPRRLRLRLAAAFVVALVVSGCSLTPPDKAEDLKTNVQVDTAELRDLKATTKLVDCAPGTGPASDGGLPEMVLPCLGGGTDVKLSSLQGPMVINLWASWCKPCRRELPIYQQFHEQYGDQVAVLGIDFQDTQPGAALSLVKETGVTYPQLADPNGDLSFADPIGNIFGLPGMLFVDADGSVVTDSGETRLVFQEIKSLDELKDLVEAQLGVQL